MMPINHFNNLKILQRDRAIMLQDRIALSVYFMYNQQKQVSGYLKTFLSIKRF